MSVDCDALVGYGYIVSKNVIEDSMHFVDGYNFWDFLDDHYNNLQNLNSYIVNPDIFIGKKIYEEDLEKLVANPNIVNNWEHEAYKMYRRIFKDKKVIPKPQFFIGSYWH